MHLTDILGVKCNVILKRNETLGLKPTEKVIRICEQEFIVDNSEVFFMRADRVLGKNDCQAYVRAIGANRSCGSREYAIMIHNAGNYERVWVKKEQLICRD
jgi:hypothetical protein